VPGKLTFVANRLQGGAENDLLDGLGGHDLLEGQAGLDALLGFDGNDDLRGGPDNDTLLGAAGDDLLNGGPGPSSTDADYMSGGSGAEVDGDTVTYEGRASTVNVTLDGLANDGQDADATDATDPACSTVWNSAGGADCEGDTIETDVENAMDGRQGADVFQGDTGGRHRQLRDAERRRRHGLARGG
jgi:hypothetical protein